MLYGQTFAESPITSQSDGTALTAAAAASMLPAAAKMVLPAGFWAVGRKVQIYASGRITTVNTTPGSARFDIRFGATVVFDSLAIALSVADTYTNVGWELEINLTCRLIGSAAQLWGQGKWFSPNIVGVTATPPKAAGVAMLPWNSAPALGTAFDSMATQIVDAFYTQTVATGSLTCHQFELITKN